MGDRALGRWYRGGMSIRFFAAAVLLMLLLAAPTLAATTQVHVVKYANDGTTILDERTLTIADMETNLGLPVYGDGTTHYYFQGPTFDFNNLWDPAEEVNVLSRDYGAVKGTDVRDLCNLVGGMKDGEYVTIKASDSFAKSFDYDDVYTPDPDAMRMVLAWYVGEDGTGESQGVGYPPGFYSGMRLFFFADTSTNPWGYHVFGLWDMHENLAEDRWHYYYDGNFWPSSSGLSVKYVDRVLIYSDDPVPDVGDIQITSSPEGATISIDDVDVKQATNATLTGLDLGTHLVRVALDWYRMEEQEVEVRWDEPAVIHFNLDRMEGSVKVTSTPPRAKVFLDGTDTMNVTPCTLTGIRPVVHTVTAKLSGYTDVSDTITVEDGETAELDLELATADSGSGSGSGETASSSDTGGSLVTVAQGQVRGGVLFATTPGGPWTLERGASRTQVLQLDLPPNATIMLSRLFVFMGEEPSAAGTTTAQADPIVTVGDRVVTPAAAYRDCRPGESRCPVIRTLAFDLLGRAFLEGEIPINVEHPGGQAGPLIWYGAGLVVAYEREGDPETRYWISEGADGILSDRDSPLPESESRTLADFPGEVNRSLVREAVLLPVSTVPEGGKGDGHLVTFNGNRWVSPLSGDGVWSARMNVRPYLRSAGNQETVESEGVSGRGDLMENRAAILVVTYGNGTTGEEPAGIEPLVPPEIDAMQPGGSSPSAGILPGENATSPEELPACLNLTVTSSPDRALVSLDGTYLSKVTPLTLACVARGVHEVKLGRDNFKDRAVTVDLQADTTIHEDLSSAFPLYASLLRDYSEKINVTADRCGGVYVTSYTEKASILLDGKDTGQLTNAVLTGLKPGLHTIRIRSDKTELSDNTRQVWVYPSVISSVGFESWPPVKREVTVQSAYLRKAEFTVNGRYPSFKIPRKVTLPSWESFITVRVNGTYLSYPAWAIDHNGTLQVRRQDPSALTTLQVVSDPRGADILVDGFPTGLTTPAVIRNLSPGSHRVLVSAPGYLPREELIIQQDMPGEGPDNVHEFFLDSNAYGSLELTSTPPGARIFIFQRDTGEKTPHVFPYLDIGTYDVKLEGEADSRTFYGITVTPYGHTSRHVNLSVV